MLVRIEYKEMYSLAVAYFMTFCVSLHQCSGCSETGGSHTQITSTLQRMLFFQVQAHHYKKYAGLISKVCEERFTRNKAPISPDNNCCWRVNEGNILCPGKRRDIQDLVVSIPVILAIEVGDESVGLNRHLGSERQYWDFPPTISPDSPNSAKKFGMIYDLVGFTLVNIQGTHFTARYTSHNRKIIYMYDSLVHKGYPLEEQAASFQTHIVGHDVELPEGFTIWQAYYLLHSGLKVQIKFFEIQTKEYASKYHLHFSEKTLDNLPTLSYRHEGQCEMPVKDRTWIKNPERAETTEYIPDKPHTLSDYQGFLDLHGLRVGYMWVGVRVRIPVPATYKISPRTSKTDGNWWRYGQNGRKHHLAHISVISWSFWLIFGGKTRRVAGKGPWGRGTGTPKKPQGYSRQSLHTLAPAAADGPESEEETLPLAPLGDLAHASSQESLPSSEFDLNCRCGATGDGNVVYHQEDGEVMQCDE